jgi:hypothetical protein
MGISSSLGIEKESIRRNTVLIAGFEQCGVAAPTGFGVDRFVARVFIPYDGADKVAMMADQNEARFDRNPPSEVAKSAQPM